MAHPATYVGRQGPSRPLPPTPTEVPATTVAQKALKAASEVNRFSQHRLSGGFPMPNIPNELSNHISLLIADAANNPTQISSVLNEIHELLEDVFVQIFLMEKDDESLKAWMFSLRINYVNLQGAARCHKINIPESRFLQICNKIENNIEPNKDDAKIESVVDSLDILDIYQRDASRKFNQKIFKIAGAILVVVGLVFAARFGINRFLTNK